MHKFGTNSVTVSRDPNDEDFDNMTDLPLEEVELDFGDKNAGFRIIDDLDSDMDESYYD